VDEVRGSAALRAEQVAVRHEAAQGLVDVGLSMITRPMSIPNRLDTLRTLLTRFVV
jgi:hypothetical protein